MGRLDGKIVMVTGGSGLLGTAIVHKIFDEGGVGINADISVTSDMDVQNIYCDITDAQSIASAIAVVVNKFGRVDGLVNNAYPRTADWGNKFENITIDSWRKNVDVQMNSCFAFCQAICEQMKKQNSGSIVNMGSIYGVTAPDFSIYDNTEMTLPAAYSAIKGGVIQFTKYLASYFGSYNIRVNCVSPGGIFDHQNADFVGNYEKKVPLKRMGNPSDIAGPVSFLLSNESNYITGHNLIVDGGWTII